MTGTPETADGPHEGSGGVSATSESTPDRADRLQERLAIPVLVAALASVPAVFLTLFDGTAETVGTTINTASGAVLVAEAAVLFLVSENRLQWLRRNWWLVALAVIIIPAVLFAFAPVQLLRLVHLVRMAGALRIIRVKRILKAGRILRKRADLDHGWQRAIGVLVSLLVAGFVAVVLADPTSESRQLVENVVDLPGPLLAIVAGGLVGAATFVVARSRGDDGEADDEDAAEREGADEA